VDLRYNKKRRLWKTLQKTTIHIFLERTPQVLKCQKRLGKKYYLQRFFKGTERPWTSRFEDFKEAGTYYCAVCGNSLFKSNTKFDSGCGWPSFFEPLTKTSIIYLEDNTLGMKRTEVQCGRCKSHLGHVFEDGPPPTGLRYCINGVVLDFVPKPVEKK
jgi:peptide-methionine (R)-S-oxide reductase